MVGHNASGFDNYIVLNSLPKSYENIKIIKNSRGLIKLSFKSGPVFEDDRKRPKYMKGVCSTRHISRSLESIQKENNQPPHLLNGAIEHDLITLSNCMEHEKL